MESNLITEVIETNHQNKRKVLKRRDDKSIQVTGTINSDCTALSDIQFRNKTNVVRNKKEKTTQLESYCGQFYEDGCCHSLEHEFLIDLKDRVRKVGYQIIIDRLDHYIKGIDIR